MKKEIKISDKLMDALVLKFFESQKINWKRKRKNIEKDAKVASGEIPINSPESNDIPMFNCTINCEIDISEEDVQEYFDLYNSSLYEIRSTIPYFSLISTNAINDLQVYLNQYDGKAVTVADLNCKSRFYEKVDEKYIFIN